MQQSMRASSSSRYAAVVKLSDESTFFLSNGGKPTDAAFSPDATQNMLIAATEVESSCREGKRGGAGEHQKIAATQGIKDVTQASEI